VADLLVAVPERVGQLPIADQHPRYGGEGVQKDVLDRRESDVARPLLDTPAKSVYAQIADPKGRDAPVRQASTS